MSGEPTGPRQIRVGGGWAFVYVVLSMAFLGAAIYLVVIREAPLTSPQVLVAGLGAVWFAGRSAMTFARRR